MDGKRLVLDAVDIVRLIGETVRLKKAGRRYGGLCPFHSEKTPSFTVDAERQFFYCFGCKKGGNAIDFVIERDRLEFRDALQHLADWAGIELPRSRGDGRPDRRRQLFEALSAAAAFYRKLLHDPASGRAAREYMQQRGFADATIEQFGVGVAPAAWDALSQALARKFPPDLLIEAGLVKSRDRGDGPAGHYDTFRNRVVFPIRDEQGRPIAFGGRILPGDDSPAKYLNSPETPLFSKSRVLFGLDLARRPIVETGTAVVLEGYMDVAAAHQFGIANAVAVLGTSLTRDHAAVLRRLCERVVLLFDADAAGEGATRRSIELFLSEPVEVHVARLPDGLDPDEFLQQQGKEAFEELIARAPDALAYEWRRLIGQIARGGDSLTAQQRAVEEFLGTLGEARKGAGKVDPLRWGAVLTRVSRLTGVPVDQLQQRSGASGGQGGGSAGFAPSPPRRRQGQAWVAGGSRQWRRPWRGRDEPQYTGPKRSELGGAASDTGSQRAQAQLLGALFQDSSLWSHVQAHVSPEAFTDRRYRWLAETFWDHLRHEGEVRFAEWLDVMRQHLPDRPDSLDRARSTCIELMESAARLGEPRQVAGEAVRFFVAEREKVERSRLVAAAGGAGGVGEEALRELEQSVRSGADGQRAGAGLGRSSRPSPAGG